MKKTLWFFCQMLIAGGAISQTLPMTQSEAAQYRDELAKGDGVRKVYMTPISIGDML